jgi:hypothetical protein
MPVLLLIQHDDRADISVVHGRDRFGYPLS